MDSFKKYLKYKEKYLNLKSQIGGMKGPGSMNWGKSISTSVNPQVLCKDLNEQRVNNCKLILEDQHGNIFMGANGTNITSSRNKSTVGLTGIPPKSIEKVLTDIHERVKDNDKITLPHTEVEKFKQETYFDKNSTIDKIIEDNSGDAKREHAGDEIYPGGGGGGGGGPRVITRSIKERELFVRGRIVSEYPAEYSYVIEKGYKLKIIQPPGTGIFGSNLGGARDGAPTVPGDKNCLNMRWEETTDDCLRREVLEEANVDLAALCTNWATNPKPDKPPVPVENVLYFDHYEPVANNCCVKYYYLKISDTLRPHFLTAYNRIISERATEFFNGDFRPKAGGTTGSSSGRSPSGGTTSGP